MEFDAQLVEEEIVIVPVVVEAPVPTSVEVVVDAPVPTSVEVEAVGDGDEAEADAEAECGGADTKNTLKFSEIIATLAAKHGTPVSTMKTILTEFCDVVKDNVAQGTSVNIPGLGKFCRIKRNERMCSNPKDREQKINVPAYFATVFRPFKDFKDKVKSHPVA